MLLLLLLRAVRGRGGGAMCGVVLAVCDAGWLAAMAQESKSHVVTRGKRSCGAQPL